MQCDQLDAPQKLQGPTGSEWTTDNDRHRSILKAIKTSQK